jgi:hypothetical protein
MKWMKKKPLHNFFNLDARKKKDFPKGGDKMIAPTIFYPKEQLL